MNEVAEAVYHGTLEGDSSFFHAKGHESIHECAPWGCECHIIMVFFLDIDLVIAKKSVHEGKGLMSGACIDDLIDEWCWEVVFGTHPIEVIEVCANTDGTLFFIHGNKIQNPSGVCNGVDKVGCAQLFYINLSAMAFEG